MAVNDNGEQTGSPGFENEDVSMCTDAIATGGRAEVTVTSALGTFNTGVQGTAGPFDSVVRRDGKMDGAEKLSELPALIENYR